ncbi:MAG: sensor histidine kinase, partial [Deltaproteobacteria bacterium]|nr:sensor histidine kinase [Deltaproteobacteria bacterium]
VSAENIKPNSEDSDDPEARKQVRISIQDHGRGIPREVLDKIFEPYFSSKESVTQKGLGLGLSICYSIVEKHDGHIEVESKVGTGTTFHVYLPASED